MANIDLKNLTQVFGENASIAAVPTAAQSIVACNIDEALKINSLYIANIDGVNASTITVDIYDGSAVLTYLVKGLSVGAGGTVNVVTADSPIYVTEGQSIRLTASAVDALSGFVSYERII